MVEVPIRFWTDKIAEGGQGKIAAKHMWDSGVVRISSNKAHAVPGTPIPFNGLAAIPEKMEKLFLQQGLTVHLSRKQRRRYLVAE